MHNGAVIIGGGISGLTVAHFLSSKKIPKITVLESTNRLGGVLRSCRGNSFYMEAGADAFDGRELATLDLCHALGLHEELLKTEPTLQNVFLSQDEKLFPINLSDPSAVFKSPALNFRARVRLLCEMIVSSRKEEGDESIATFTRRRLGRTVFKTFVKPLVQGVLMADPERLSLREYFPQWRKMEQEQGGIMKAFLKKRNQTKHPAPFLTIRGGLDRLTDALGKKLEGVDLQRNAEVISMRREKNWKVFLKDGREIQTDTVCLAIPAWSASRLLLKAAPALVGDLDKIRYDSMLAVNMIFHREDLSGKFRTNGYVVPSHGEKWPFANLKIIGATEDGKSIRLRAFFSKTFQTEAFSWNDETIKREVLRCLVREWNILTLPSWMTVERYPKALAQYEAGHHALVLEIEKKLQDFPGLFLTGNAYRGFGISDCIREAKRVAREMETMQASL